MIASALPPCAQCDQYKPIMVVMQRGLDGKDWQLCQACFLDGTKPMKLGRIPARYRDDMEITRTTEGVATTPTGQYPYQMVTRAPAGLAAKPPPKKKTSSRKKSA